ncbi:unnamed protein product [Dicrocoelium dendriticum]|nr:unnamed protein product [Dicrocoelium dendriticum]
MKRISHWTHNLDKMNIPHEDTVREDAPFKLTVEEPVTSSCREEDSLTADASDLETKPNYLVAFHVTTAGKQQEEHRSDEYPVVLITAKLIDLENPQSKSPEFEAYIRPVRQLIVEGSDRSTDEVTGDTGPLCCPFTQSVIVVPLTEECRIATGLTDAMLADAGTLEDALEQFDRWLHVQGLSNDDIATFNAKLTGMPLKYADKQRRGETTELATTGSGSQCPHTLSTTRSCFSKISGYTQPMVLLTDGPTDLRLLLHPEATVQSVDLTRFPYLYHYIDVKKEYKRIFQKGSGSTSITEMLTYAERSMECLTNEANRIPQECQSRSLESLPMESDSTKGSEFAGCADMVYETCEVSGSRSNRNAPLQPMEEIRFPPALSSRRSLPIQHCRKLAELACYMTSQVTLFVYPSGCDWNHVETIQMSYQPAIL